MRNCLISWGGRGNLEVYILFEGWLLKLVRFFFVVGMVVEKSILYVGYSFYFGFGFLK